MMDKRCAVRVNYLVERMIFQNDDDDMVDQRQIVVAGSACALNCERRHDGGQHRGDHTTVH